MNQIKPCPFCGKEVDLEDGDTLYPSGVGWEVNEDGSFSHYTKAYDVPPNQWCWKLTCSTISGGCGAEMHGDSKQDTINRWSKRS